MSRTDEIIEANEAMRREGEEEKPKKKRAPRKKKEEVSQSTEQDVPTVETEVPAEPVEQDNPTQL